MRRNDMISPDCTCRVDTWVRSEDNEGGYNITTMEGAASFAAVLDNDGTVNWSHRATRDEDLIPLVGCMLARIHEMFGIAGVRACVAAVDFVDSEPWEDDD